MSIKYRYIIRISLHALLYCLWHAYLAVLMRIFAFLFMDEVKHGSFDCFKVSSSEQVLLKVLY